MRIIDLEPGSLYWLPKTLYEPAQRAVLIEVSGERDSVLFEVLPTDRPKDDPRGGRREFVKRDWAVERVQPCYDGA